MTSNWTVKPGGQRVETCVRDTCLHAPCDCGLWDCCRAPDPGTDLAEHQDQVPERLRVCGLRVLDDHNRGTICVALGPQRCGPRSSLRGDVLCSALLAGCNVTPTALHGISGRARTRNLEGPHEGSRVVVSPSEVEPGTSAASRISVRVRVSVRVRIGARVRQNPSHRRAWAGYEGGHPAAFEARLWPRTLPAAACPMPGQSRPRTRR